MIYRRNGRPRSVRGRMNLECRVLRRNQRRGKNIFFFKLVSMFFWTSVAKVQNRGLLFCFKQTSGWTTPKQQLPTHKLLLARRLRELRRTGSSSEWWQYRITSKPSSLIEEGDGVLHSFSDVLPCICLTFVFLFSCVFRFIVCILPSFERRYERREESSFKHRRGRETRARWMRSSSRADHLSSSFSQKGTVASR